MIGAGPLAPSHLYILSFVFLESAVKDVGTQAHLFLKPYRRDNVIKTLRGKTVSFEPAADIKNDTEEDEQP